MKTEIKKVYYCEFCKKHMLSAGSMALHEKFCKERPENKHKCFDLCRHLKRQLRMGANQYGITEFICEKTGQKMYSYLAEKKNHLLQFAPANQKINLEGLVKMPVSCAYYQYMSESEYNKRFDIDQWDD